VPPRATTPRLRPTVGFTGPRLDGIPKGGAEARGVVGIEASRDSEPRVRWNTTSIDCGRSNVSSLHPTHTMISIPRGGCYRAQHRETKSPMQLGQMPGTTVGLRIPLFVSHYVSLALIILFRVSGEYAPPEPGQRSKDLKRRTRASTLIQVLLSGRLGRTITVPTGLTKTG
jgi:hypothetical protein